jgi:hypothetical protein
MDPLSSGRGAAGNRDSRGTEVPCLSDRDGVPGDADAFAIADEELPAGDGVALLPLVLSGGE